MSVRFDPAELASWCGGRWDPAPPAAMAGVTQDTRRLQEGNLYVALKGENFDGHDFVADALRKGAAAAMVERDWRAREGSGPLLRVADSRRALRDLARGHTRKVAPHRIAVTGSFGKSTVKEMTAAVLGSRGPVSCTRGNWNNDIGLPLSLLAMDPTTRIAVVELGTNHPGEIGALCGLLEPQWGIVTGIGPVHIEHFGTEEAIAHEKGCLLDVLPPAGLAILNRDDPHFELLQRKTAVRSLTVSMSGPADYRLVERRPDTLEALVEEASTGERHWLRLRQPGEFIVANALFAVAVGRAMQVGWEEIGAALLRYTPLPMRWESLVVRGVTLVNDAYNANPVSMKAALRAFAETRVAGRRWVVLSGMLELGPHEREAHLTLGRTAAAGPWAGLLAVGERGRLIAEGARESGLDAERLIWCASNADAARRLRELAAEGDSVLFKASRGMRLEEVISGFSAAE